MTTDLFLKFLTRQEVGDIYEKCLHFLSTNGVTVDHREALKKLSRAGAHVDFDSQLVRFPRDIIEEALRTVPHGAMLAGHHAERDIVLPHPNGMFYVSNSTGVRLFVEPGTNNYRYVTLADIAQYGQLTEALDEIDVSLFLTPDDAPGETADIHSMRTILENTSKHIEVQPWSFESIKYLFELGATVAGAETLKKRPVCHIFSCSISPLILSDMDTEVILQACRLGVPIGAYSLPSAGANSPITIPGTVLLASIEILAQLVMSQIFNPGNPVIGGLSSLTLDMSSGKALQDSLESILISAAFVQFIKEGFHIPTKVTGFGTDSYIPDAQAIEEITLRGILVSLAGGDMLTTAGRLHSALAMSPVKLIIDNKLAKVLKGIKVGTKVDDDSLAWNEILNMEPGGHYLELPHTLKHCRESLRSGLQVTQSRDTWSAEGGKDMEARIVEEYQEIKKTLKPPEVPDHVKNELDRIVKHADKILVK